MKGLILENAYLKRDTVDYQMKRLKDEFQKLGVEIDVKNNNFFAGILDENGKIQKNLPEYDFCIYMDKDKYVATILEKLGLKLFNKPQAIFDCDDKMQTYLKLANHDIPMPKTIPGLLCYHKQEQIRPETITFVEKELGYPLVAKSCYGSLGSGVFKIDNKEALVEIMEQLKCKPHLFQKYISASYGKDMRVIVIGGKFTCGYMRKSDNDFRSNIALGGKGYKITIPENVKKLCEKVSKILDLDYCGVDILFDKDGYKLCEVNSNAYFEGAEKTTGINVAKAFAQYVIAQIRK